MNATAQAWKNWSGSVQAQPSRLASPRTEDELSTIVRGAAKVRVVGAGHSFMPLCAGYTAARDVTEQTSILGIIWHLALRIGMWEVVTFLCYLPNYLA